MHTFTLIILRGELSLAALQEQFFGNDTPILLTPQGENPLSYLKEKFTCAWGNNKIVCLPKNEKMPILSSSEWKNIARFGHHEELCLSLAETCEWAFFPWVGYWDSFFFAFLAHDSEQADKLVAICEPSMLISRYDNIATPENICQGIEWHEGRTDIHIAAKLAWRLGELEKNHPILVCNFFGNAMSEYCYGREADWELYTHLLEVKMRREYEVIASDRDDVPDWPRRTDKYVQILYQTENHTAYHNFWNPNAHDDTPISYVTSGLVEAPNILRNATTLQNLGTRCGWALARIYYGAGEEES
jgi:hypothetical protein